MLTYPAELELFITRYNFQLLIRALLYCLYLVAVEEVEEMAVAAGI